MEAKRRRINSQPSTAVYFILPAREWSRRDASDIDGQARGLNERDANESKLSEFLLLTSNFADSEPLLRGGARAGHGDETQVFAVLDLRRNPNWIRKELGKRAV